MQPVSETVEFRHIAVDQFPSPHLRHAAKAPTFIPRVTCFPRWRRAVLAITAEGRPLSRHAASDVHHRVFLCQLQPLQTIGAIKETSLAGCLCRDISAVTVTHHKCYGCHLWHFIVQQFYCKIQTTASCLALLCKLYCSIIMGQMCDLLGSF